VTRGKETTEVPVDGKVASAARSSRRQAASTMTVR
jgi:hypothetical protein